MRPHEGERPDLAARVHALTRSQREALATLLAERVGGQSGLRPHSLAAFVTVEEGAASTPEELRDHVRSVLPEHMVPADVRVIEAIPRLPNGKVDKAALLALPEEPVTSLPSSVAPRNDVERTLASIWSEVLQVDEISVHDAFFELGGDSILSIHVTSRANQQGLGLSPNDIFNFPTIAQLATRCANGSEGAVDPSAGTSAVVGSAGEPFGRPPLFLVHVGIKLAARLRTHLGPDQPMFCFSAHWHRADLELDATVEDLAGACLAELRTLQPSGPYYIGGYSMGAPIAWEMARQLRTEGQTVAMLFLLDPPPARDHVGIEAPVNRIRFEDALSEAHPRTLGQKVASHVRVLTELPWSKRTAYLWSETLVQLQYRLLEPMKLWTSIAMRRVGLGVPTALRGPYVLMVYVRAWSRYDAGEYDGNVVVFIGRNDESEATLGSWRALTHGNVDVETFEGAHLDFVMDDALVDQWAGSLATVLEERQAGVPALG